MQYKYQWKVAATRAEVRKNAAAQAIAEELGILPPTAQLLVNRGCAYELQGDRDRATADFRAALNLDHTFQPAIDGLTRLH